MAISNPTSHEVRLVIQFLNAKNIHFTEIYCQLVEVCGEGAMNEGNVHKARSRHPSIITED
jgi:hypothetical protein